MELRELKSFVVAAKYRSVSKAAKELNIGQPTVTTHVKKLEKELSVSLFDRVTRPIRLTLAGQSIYELTVPLLDGIESLSNKTTDMEDRGPVIIATTADIIPHTLLPVVHEYNKQHPKVFLKIKSMSRKEVIDGVKSGEVDAGIIQRLDRGDKLNFDPLFVYERVLIAPKNHSLLQEPLTSLSDIAKYPLIMMASGSYTREILETQFRKLDVRYNIIMELESMDMIKRFVSQGMGVSVGPRLAIEELDLDKLGMVSLANFLPVDRAGIITLPGKNISKPAAAIIKLMSSMLTDVNRV